MNRRRIVIGLFMALIYTVLAALASVLVSKWTEGDTLGVGSDHSAAIRACLVSPGNETLDDVGGLHDAKAALRRSVVTPMKHPELFFKGPKPIRPPRGVLLHGPPGTGKTMLARALANECNAKFLALTSATLESKWWGESAKLVQAAFDLARKDLQPCIIFFDEIDGLGRTRSEGDQACVYSFKTELLRNLDGIDSDRDAAVIVLACTNCVHALDPALRRRLPLVVDVGLPDASAREEILRKLLREEPRKTKGLAEAVAAKTEGKSGSDLVALFADASARRLAEADLDDLAARSRTGDQVLRSAGALRLKHFDLILAK